MEDIEDMDFDFYEHHKNDVFGTWEDGKNEMDYSIARNLYILFFFFAKYECVDQTL